MAAVDGLPICDITSQKKRPGPPTGISNYLGILIFRELHREELQKNAFIFTKKEDDIVFPPGGASSNWFTLTYVNVTNLMPSGKEGRVTLADGGVGHRNVTLHLESQRGEGYHFLVVIRGKNSPD